MTSAMRLSPWFRAPSLKAVVSGDPATKEGRKIPACPSIRQTKRRPCAVLMTVFRSSISRSRRMFAFSRFIYTPPISRVRAFTS